MNRLERRCLFGGLAIGIGIMLWGVISAVWSNRGAGTPAPIGQMLAIVGAATLVMVIVVVITLRVNRRKRGSPSDVQAWAEAAGHGYIEEGDAAFGESVRTLPCISGKATNEHLVSGAIEAGPFLAFQNTYMLFLPEMFYPVTHSVYTLEGPDFWVPVRISRRSWSARFVRRMGFRKGMAIGSAEFNDTFDVGTQDHEFASAILTSEVQAFLLGLIGGTWKIEPGRLALVRGGTLKPLGIEASIEDLTRFWNLIPEELRGESESAVAPEAKGVPTA